MKKLLFILIPFFFTQFAEAVEEWPSSLHNKLAQSVTFVRTLVSSKRVKESTSSGSLLARVTTRVIQNNLNSSGFAIGNGHFVLTCFHGIDNRKSCAVSSLRNETQMGKVVKTDPKDDLALIWIKKPLPPLQLATASRLRSFESIHQIVHPMDKKCVEKVGYFLYHFNHQDFFTIRSEHGNSGSPLFNQNGEVISMVMATNVCGGITTTVGRDLKTLKKFLAAH